VPGWLRAQSQARTQTAKLVSMILVDTSVWVDYLRSGRGQLKSLLENAQVLAHPCVIGELACGDLQNRTEILELLTRLPMATCASDHEVLHFIEQHRIMGRGVGYIDVQILASARLSHDTQLWTRDKRLAAVASELSVAH